MKARKIRFLDLFAGAGGLSEGFIRAGFSPVAHVEIDPAACCTLKTRMAYHWLHSRNQLDIYHNYLNRKMSRQEFYSAVPQKQIMSVINSGIGNESLQNIFSEIDRLLEENHLDLIIGGPPCQAYSLVGRSRDKKRMTGDKRNYLYLYYAEFLKKYKPDYFIFENVTGLQSARGVDGNLYFDNMLKLFRDNKYEVEFKVLSANEYGVLQQRKRIILVGRRGKTTGFYPEPEKWNPKVQVRELFRDIPSIQAGDGLYTPCALKKYSGRYLYDAGIRNHADSVTYHCARPHTEQDLEIYRIAVEKWETNRERLKYDDLPARLKTHKNRASFTDRFKVVAADLPYSHTVVAHISKDGHYYIHPDARQNRSLTPREAARLQTFPDDYFFETVSGVPGRTPAFLQIGNAVPVLLSQRIAQKLMEVWR